MSPKKHITIIIRITMVHSQKKQKHIAIENVHGNWKNNIKEHNTMVLSW